MSDESGNPKPQLSGSAQAEINAMQEVASALADLEDEAAARVLRWAAEILKLGPPSLPSAPIRCTDTIERTTESSTKSSPREQSDFSDLAEFYSTVGPSSDAEKALVVGYWIQFKEGQSDLDTQSVNSELKHLGYGIGNITRAFDALTKTRPQLVIQTRKSGTSQQARKKFKLTFEGKRRVESMLMHEGSHE